MNTDEHRWKTLVRHDLSIAPYTGYTPRVRLRITYLHYLCSSVFICGYSVFCGYSVLCAARAAALDRLTAFLAGFSSMDQDWLKLVVSERWALLAATAAHLELVIEAVVMAVIVGVPLGILAARRPLVERAAVGITSVLQTIPSLALLGFLLIAFRGQIGKPPALAALVLYALLPIVKNTILGLQSIDPGVREASLGLGMTGLQRLRLVELPLAMPIILGGIRVATVASVGMATIAAAIGARGLGGYIFRGVSLLDTRQILLGSIPAAVLALVCDAALGELERLLDPTRPRHSRIRGLMASCSVALIVGLAGWGWWLERRPTDADHPTITIGSKDGSEMILLGHMLADLVEAQTPIHVDRRFNLGGTLVCYNALRLGGLDAYVEYTGTALTTILKEPVQTDPRKVLDLVRAELHGRDKVACLEPVRIREHVRHPDAPGAGRQTGHQDPLRPPRPPGRAPVRLRPRVHEPPRRLSRADPRLRPAVRPRPA